MKEKFIRLRPYNDTSLEDVVNVMRLLKITCYCVSREELPGNIHYHLYLKTDYSNERLRYQLKSKLDMEVWISNKDVEDKVRAIAYTIKDGHYAKEGIDINTFLMAKATSFQKKTFDKDLKELYDKKYTQIEDVVKDVVELYLKYGRKLYSQHIQALARTIFAKQNDDYKKVYIRRLIETL